MSLSSGDVVDRYVIERQIGSGGMGVVYLAHDADGKPIAIKTISLPPHIDVSPKSPNYQRFIRELDVISNVDHVNIVRFIAGGRQPTDHTGTLLWLAQEYIPGPTLRQQIAAAPGRIPVVKVVRWFRQLFEALGVLHDSDFQHRDLKPENILFLTEDDVPKIIDFGVASSKRWRRLTRQMTAMGTFDYMSPEQLDPSVDENAPPAGKRDRGLSRKVIDARTDIYTLGYIAWETLAGRRPFEPTPGASLTEILMQRRAMVIPPVQEVRPDVPDELSELIQRLVEPDRDQRLQTAFDAVTEFDRVLKRERKRARPRHIRNITDVTPTLATTGVSIATLPDDKNDEPPLTRLEKAATEPVATAERPSRTHFVPVPRTEVVPLGPATPEPRASTDELPTVQPPLETATSKPSLSRPPPAPPEPALAASPSAPSDASDAAGAAGYAPTDPLPLKEQPWAQSPTPPAAAVNRPAVNAPAVGAPSPSPAIAGPASPAAANDETPAVRLTGRSTAGVAIGAETAPPTPRAQRTTRRVVLGLIFAVGCILGPTLGWLGTRHLDVVDAEPPVIEFDEPTPASASEQPERDVEAPAQPYPDAEADPEPSVPDEDASAAPSPEAPAAPTTDAPAPRPKTSAPRPRQARPTVPVRPKRPAPMPSKPSPGAPKHDPGSIWGDLD